ncbi:MAG: SUMF1/EgtB/PvdO family nonheme iron enzyme [Gemmataceae bacterium]
MAAPNHPTPDALAAFVHGRLSDDDTTAIEQHLTACAACRQAVEQVPPDSFLRQVREVAPPRGTVVAPASPALPVSQPVALATAELPPSLAEHDRYRVVRLLGQGGMGAVYLAEHRLMDRPAVLKLIRPEFLARDDIRQRFEREVKAVSQLSHANIVQAYDAFNAGDSMVLAMEFVDGIDLAAFVKVKGPLAVPLACRCIQQAALGLQAAHQHSLVHRDIKPHNLMITRKGQVKILDFGLAQLGGSVGGGGLTQDGVVMGTPEYMAPEQWADPSKVDIRADLYSLGCTLFFLLTGRPPFPGPGTLALLRQHADVPPSSLREACPDVPEALEVVYQRLMAKQPGDRYATPKELAQALTPFVKGGTAVPPLPPLPPLPQSITPTHVGEGSETSPPPPQVIAPQQSARRPPRRSKPPLWLVATATGIMLTLAAVAVFWLTIRTGDGVIELEDLPADAVVRVDGRRVEVRYRNGGKAEVRVAPGERRLEVRKEGFEALGEEVSLRAGGRVLLTARLKRLANKEDRPEVSASKKAGDLIRVSLGDGVEMTFAWCPPGTFQMGSPEEEEQRDDDETQHRVTLTQGYWLGIHEVTQAQWKAVMGNNPSNFKGDNLPVENVRWDDCQVFCRKLGEKTGKRFRLPTEAEWEYACRAGTTTPFHFGETISTEQANYDGNGTYGRRQTGTYREKTTLVGSFAANAWGLYDMHGNVWEWCQDWHGDYPSGDIKDPQGESSGTTRVLRGGSWASYPWDCRAATRRRLDPGFRDVYYGCRVVLVPD